MAGVKAGGVVKQPVRRSGRVRKQYNPEIHYNATAYMKATQQLALAPQPTAPQEQSREQSSTPVSPLSALLEAVYSLFSTITLKISPKVASQDRRRTPAAKGVAAKAAGKRKRASSKRAAKQ